MPALILEIVYAVDRTERARSGLLSALAGDVPRRRAHAVTLAGLRECEEGALVRVTARVHAETSLVGALHGTPGVFRRLVFALGGATWVHERGVDFWLVDDEGSRARVCVGGGRMVV